MNLFKKLFGRKVTKSEATRRSNLRAYSEGSTTSNTTSGDSSWLVPATILSMGDGYSESTRSSSSNYDCSSSYDSSSSYSSSDSSSSSCD